MVGREVEAVFHRDEVGEGPVVLELDGVNAGRLLRDISLTVRAGEIVGIGGYRGRGPARAVRRWSSARCDVDAGSDGVERGGLPAAQSRSTPWRAGIGFLHEDRKAAGNLPDLSVRHNLTVSVLDKVRAGFGRLLATARPNDVYATYQRRLRHQGEGPDQLIGQLSGGNQQKVLLGRALAPGGRLLMLNEPTRGVDIGAKAEIHHLINELTAAGRGRADGLQRPARAAGHQRPGLRAGRRRDRRAPDRTLTSDRGERHGLRDDRTPDLLRGAEQR